MLINNSFYICINKDCYIFEIYPNKLDSMVDPDSRL